MKILSPARLIGAMLSALAISGALAGTAAANAVTYAYVTNQGDGTLTAIDLTTRTTTTVSLGSGSHPSAIATGPQGTSSAGYAFVAEAGSNSVAVVDISTNPSSPKVVATVPVGSKPEAIAITPDGNTAYIANNGDGTVTAITLAAHAYTTQSIRVGGSPQAIAITPNGELAYVLRGGNTPVVPIKTTMVPNTAAHNTLGPGFGGVGASPIALAINPNGTTGYVVSASSAQLIPFSIPQEAASPAKAYSVAPGPWALTTSVDGTAAYVVNTLSPDYLSQVNLSSGSTVGTVALTAAPWTLTLGPEGTSYANTAYVVEQNGSHNGTVTPVTLSPTLSAGSPITVGVDPSGISTSPWKAPVTGSGSNPYNLNQLGVDANKTKPKPKKPRLSGRSVKVGDQRLTLTPIVHGRVLRRRRRLCVAPRSLVILRLTGHRLRRGPATRVTRAMLFLGRHRRASRAHPPVVTRLRFKRGFHAVVAKLFLVEHRVRHVRRHHRRVTLRRTVHLRRKLRVGYRVC